MPLTFRPDVFVDLSGTVSGFGSVMVDINDHTAPGEDSTAEAAIERARQAALRRAILQAVGHDQPSTELLGMIELKILDPRRVSIKTHGSLRSEIWDRKIITFRTMLSEVGQTIQTNFIDSIGMPPESVGTLSLSVENYSGTASL